MVKIVHFTSGMLSILQSEKPSEQISFPNKKCSLSSLSATSDYSSRICFSPVTTTQFVASSDFYIRNDSLIESYKVDCENPSILPVRIKCFFSEYYFNISSFRLQNQPNLKEKLKRDQKRDQNTTLRYLPKMQV